MRLFRGYYSHYFEFDLKASFTAFETTENPVVSFYFKYLFTAP